MTTLTRSSNEPTKLGTFGGVFTPSLLTILGLVLFLRLGFVTGNVGLAQMLLILALSTSVSILTTISLAAIATNLRVGGGGVYFLISRTLGPAVGGAIGMVLYLAMSVSVAFYSIGLGEAVASAAGWENPNLPQMIAAVMIVGLVGLAWLGADIATRLQYVVMVLLIIAIVAYFVGVTPDLSMDLFRDSVGKPAEGGSFWVSFAIFFPAITGFTQGVAMSGDLRTPSKSITNGTFAAIGLSTVVYLLVILTFVAAVPLQVLRDDTAIMRQLSLAPGLVDLGVVAATLSSAIASILGAPRVLQRLAADRVVKPLNPFAITTPIGDNPRRAVLLTAAIALATVALGDLDVVAPIISMFFLASYGMINYATYSEARAASTSFRPRFRFFDWRLSLLGTLACLGAIIAIDPLAGSLAGVAIFGLYRYLGTSMQQVRWADSTRSFHASKVRGHLRMMSGQTDARRDWRPVTLAFVPRDPERRAQLLTVSSWFEGGSGFTTAARIIPGRGPVARKHAARVQLELQNEIDEAGSGVYGRVIVANDLEAGVSAMLQAHGMGPISPNLALYSWYEIDDAERANSREYETMVRTGVRFGSHVGIVHAQGLDGGAPAEGRHRRIAVWWSDDANGQLLTLLAWMATRTSVWSRATIEVWIASDQAGAGHNDADRIAGLIDDARIPAMIMGTAKPEEFAGKAGTAQLVLAPLRVRNQAMLGPGGVSIDDMVEQLPTVVFVQHAIETRLDVQPENAEMIALDHAQDRAASASERANSLDREASSLMVTAELARLNCRDGDAEAERLVKEAAAAAAAAQRRYLDARSRADEAWRLVQEMDPNAPTGAVDPEVWLESERARRSKRPRSHSRSQSS